MSQNADGLNLILGGISEDEAIVRVIDESSILNGYQPALELREAIRDWRAHLPDRQSLYTSVLRHWGTDVTIVKELIARFGIWFPRELYRRMPIVVPYVRRVRNVGPCAAENRPDRRAWPEPSTGLCSDDNSIVKALGKRNANYGTISYHGKLDCGYIAAHIWMDVLNPGRGDVAREHACTVPELNTFVPNLVWLPANMAVWTDDESGHSVAQRFTRELAIRRCRSVCCSSDELTEYVQSLWDRLPVADSGDLGEMPDVDALPEFVWTDSAIQRKIDDVRTVVQGLTDALEPQISDREILRKHYTLQHLRDLVQPDVIECLCQYLNAYYGLVTGAQHLDAVVSLPLPDGGGAASSEDDFDEDELYDNPIHGEVPIDFIPTNTDVFKSELIRVGWANRRLVFADGHVKHDVWHACHFNPTSGLMHNIKSMTFWRNRRRLGVQRAIFEIPQEATQTNGRGV